MTKPWHPRVIRGGGTKQRLRSLDEFPHRKRRRRSRTLLSGGKAVALMAFFGVSGGMLIALAPPLRSPMPDVENPAYVQIIDGDTFEYRGVRVRVADIDTPEMNGDCAEERALARRAMRRMADLIDDGPFALRPLWNRDADQYGRSLRIVTRDGRSLGDQLVAEGLARTWSGRREPWC